MDWMGISFISFVHFSSAGILKVTTSEFERGQGLFGTQPCGLFGKQEIKLFLRMTRGWMKRSWRRWRSYHEDGVYKDYKSRHVCFMIGVGIQEIAAYFSD